MEAVKQGSAAVGIKSKTHAILVALKVRKIVHLKVIHGSFNANLPRYTSVSLNFIFPLIVIRHDFFLAF